MFSLRTHAIICAALFAAMIGLAIAGNLLEKAGVRLSGAGRIITMVVFFSLFLAFGLSAIPVMVKLVLGAQVSVGNADVPAVAAASRRENTIIWTLWGLILAGTVIAVPAALIGGMFGDGPPRAFRRFIAGSNLGVLTARPDMTVADMVRQSTLPLDVQHASSAIAGSGVFDFAIPGTVIRLAGARYYYITTYYEDATRIRAINVGISADKAAAAAIDSADAELRARLAADGWLAGHEEFRTEEDQRLHGGATQGPAGRLWLKDDMVLSISRKRMDDPKPGEDSAAAGEWIRYIDLWAKKEYPSIERYVFQSPNPQRGDALMGLPERRKVRELQDTILPGRTKEIEEICGKPIPYEVDWDSIAGDINALNFLDNISCHRLNMALRMICSDEMGREAVRDGLKLVKLKNVKTKPEMSMTFDGGVLEMHYAYALGTDGMHGDNDIRNLLLKGL